MAMLANHKEEKEKREKKKKIDPNSLPGKMSKNNCPVRS
jgi:hypothetical protein